MKLAHHFQYIGLNTNPYDREILSSSRLQCINKLCRVIGEAFINKTHHIRHEWQESNKAEFYLVRILYALSDNLLVLSH